MANETTIITALRTLFEADDMFEIRILDAVLPSSNWQHTESGYFDYDHIDEVPNLLANFKTYGGVYVTLNPVNPDLLARANNRFKKAKNRETTSDKDILRRRWMLIDIDPVRPAGISATDNEKSLAFDKAMEIKSGLASMDWPEPMVVDSGNGTQLLYRIDLPADDGGLIQRCLQVLQPCSTDDVHVDLSVHNPARICRLPGTWNRKGDSTETRPHRVAEILDKPEEMRIVSMHLLRKLVGNPVVQADSTCPNKSQYITTYGDISRQVVTSYDLSSPIDDFNQRGDIAPILERHGWTLKSESDQQHWWRPGKNNGQHSATYDDTVFFVWSDNATPFESRKGYSRFGVYAILEHDNDFSAAMSALSAEGYGYTRNPADGLDISGIMAQIGDYASDNFHNGNISPNKSDICAQVTDNPHISPSLTNHSEYPPEDSDNPTTIIDPGLMPDDLLNVPGFIGEVIEHTLATSPYPNRTMAFCGALELQSYLAARRVKDCMKNRSNIYVVALASSGVGKNRPREVNIDVAFLVGLMRGIGDGFASGEGIEDAMFHNQSMLFQTDEFDAILGSINKARDGRNEMMMQILLKMFSSATSRYPLRKKAGQTEPLIIHQPSLSLYGTAVPQYFYKALSGRMLNNGLFARTLVLDAGPRCRGRKPADIPVPESIVETAKYWANFNPGGMCGGNLSGFHPDPMKIEDTPEASRRSVEIWELTDDAYENAQRLGDETKMAIWARAFEKTRKLALLYACSENHRTPRITAAGMDWAWRLVEHQTKRMLFMADLYVADSEFQSDCKRFIEFLTKHQHRKGPDAFMPHWELARRLGWPEKKIQDVRESLLAQERIELKPSSRGPTRPQYRLL